MTLQTLFDQALGFHQHGQLVDAERLYLRVLQAAPDSFEALHMLGVVRAQQNRNAEALELIGAALQLRPRDPLTLTNYGNALAALERQQEALASHDAALAGAPDYADAWNNRGNALKGLGRLDDALTSYQKAVALRPDFTGALSNQGNVLHQLGRFEDALASYDRTLAIDPRHVDAYYNRGNLLHDMSRHADAVASYNQALAIWPQHVDAWTNRGLSLQNLKRLDAALESFDRAIAIDGARAHPRYSKALCLMLAGRFAEGLPLREWRKKLPEPVEARTYPQPLWTGTEDIAGKTLFAHIEQGLGDTIQFYRYAAAAQARGAKVVLAVQDGIKHLLQRAAPQVELIGYYEKPEAFDYHIPLMSLPLALGMDHMPIPVPYLQAEPERVERWAGQLGKAGYRIGVCWEGNRSIPGGAGRSFPPEALAGIANISGVRLIGLQKDANSEMLRAAKIETLGDDFDAGTDAFLDSAAVITNLDLVISIDASMAHLAGAMGRPVWVALKYVPEWRWGLDRTDSPWYPTARLFRQQTDGDWSDVFAEMQAELVRLVR
ncbi:MAG TPA: tetratricopeptide repeat-containing glycosyltransferase family protein [Rhizomicrobium sp.]|jgi:tetratricopeptide (TPR) repeat protein